MKTFIFLLVSAVATTCVAVPLSGSNYDYSGYKLFRVTAENKDEQNVLLSLRYSYEVATPSSPAPINFWTEPAIGYPTDFMVSPELHDFVKATLAQHSMQCSCIMEDVQLMIQAQLSLNHPSNQNGQIDWTSYHRYDAIAAWVNELATTYPNLVSLGSIGSSGEGRDLFLIKVSNGVDPANKPVIFIDGNFHAREWISPAVVTYILNELVTKSENHSELLDKVDFHFVPIVNPDGYEYTHTADRMWRKTRANITTSICKGVDPNRNFDVDFGGSGSSTNPCAETYLGAAPFNIPETKHLSDYLSTNGGAGRIKAYLSMHSYSQAWLTPYAYTDVPPSRHNETMDLAIRAVEALTSVYGTKYIVGPTSTTLYFHSGASQDWTEKSGIKYSYTVELRDTGSYGFLLPPAQILPTSMETFEAVKVVAKQVISEFSK